MASINKCFLLPLCLGLVILLVGILMVTVIFPNIIEKQVISNVELKEDTLQWYRFEKIPFPFNLNVYLFTIENKDEVLAGQKPNVTQVGPFVYREHREKVIHKIENDQIMYSDSLTYVFNETESGENTEEQMITVLNSPLLAVLQNLEVISFDLGIDIQKDVLEQIFLDTNVFMEVKVKDLTFGGIKMCDPAMNPGGVAKLVCLVIMLMNQKLLEYHEDLSMSFSLFNYKTKLDGPFSLNNGINTIENLGLISSYKEQEYTQFWEGEQNQCDKVNGYYTTFPPFMEKSSVYSVYSTDICKPIEIKQTSLSTYKEIPSYRFEAFDKSLASEEQSCVCINRTKGFEGENRCYRDAVLDMSTCMGVPVILSFPHLMWAEQSLQESITGLEYSEDDHKTIIDFEPNLGYPMSGHIRLQFNMILRPIMFANKPVELTENLPKAVFPLLWLDNNFEFTDSLVEEVNTKLLDMLDLAMVAQWTIIGVGAGIAALSVVLMICCRRK